MWFHKYWNKIIENYILMVQAFNKTTKFKRNKIVQI